MREINLPPGPRGGCWLWLLSWAMAAAVIGIVYYLMTRP